MVASFEVLANTVRTTNNYYYLLQEIYPEPEIYAVFIAVGILRSFLCWTLFSTLAISEQKKRIRQLLSISDAELYVETLYLQKSIEQIERLQLIALIYIKS